MKNKILAISIIFILLSCLFINISFASESTITTTLPSISNIVSSGDKWLVFYHPTQSAYRIIVTDASSLLFNGNYGKDGYLENNFYIKATDFTYIKYYKINNNTWELYTQYIYDNGYTVTNPSYLHFPFPLLENLCASNFDLYNNENVFNNNDLVFQKAPILSTLKGMNFQTVMGVFQTMMSGITPYLIALVVGLVAFWKAWSILSRTLRRA